MNDVLDTYKVVWADKDSSEVLTIEKEYDQCAENPREYFESETTFYTFERRRYSPDKHNFQDASQWADENGFDLGKSPVDLIKSIRQKGYIALPVWRYEHSGVAYRASAANPFYDDWDSGMVGVIYISRKDARKMFDVKRITPKVKEQVLELMKAEVETYSAWADGDVFAYYLYDSGGEQLDGISTIYGDYDINKIFKEFGVKELEATPA